MPRYPTNARRNYSSRFAPSGRRDSFQGRGRGVLERRSSGEPRVQRPPLQPEINPEDLVEQGVQIAIDNLPIPYFPLLRRLLHLYQDYQRLNALFNPQGGMYVDPSVWFVHPTGWCSIVRGTPYGQSRLGGGGCGEIHEFNDDPLPLTSSSIDMCFIDPLIPGLFAKWRATYWGNYQRYPGTDGQLGVGTRPWVYPFPGVRENPWPSLNPEAEPVEVPGMPVRPSPQPVPAALADALPKTAQGQLLRGYVAPWELPVKAPDYVVMPIEGLGPVYLPVAQLGTEVSVTPGQAPVQRPSQHRNARPPFRTKERKFILSAAGGSLAGMIIGAVTESDDFIDDLWNALPDDLKKSHKRYKGKDGKWHVAKVGELQKAQAVFLHFDSIDLGAALHNVIVDQATDAAYGRLGRLNAKAQRNVHDAGYGPGIRNAGSASNLANRGQIPRAAGWVSPAVKRSVDSFLSNFK